MTNNICASLGQFLLFGGLFILLMVFLLYVDTRFQVFAFKFEMQPSTKSIVILSGRL